MKMFRSYILNNLKMIKVISAFVIRMKVLDK